MSTDSSIQKLVQEQTVQWSELVERHRKEEWALLKQQVQEQQETLDKLMETIQANQLKQLESKFERYYFPLSF